MGPVGGNRFAGGAGDGASTAPETSALEAGAVAGAYLSVRLWWGPGGISEQRFPEGAAGRAGSPGVTGAIPGQPEQLD